MNSAVGRRSAPPTWSPVSTIPNLQHPTPDTNHTNRQPPRPAPGSSFVPARRLDTAAHGSHGPPPWGTGGPIAADLIVTGNFRLATRCDHSSRKTCLVHDHDTRLLVYAQLAAVCQSRGQLAPRDRFLVLTGMAALQAGLPTLAERCREMILQHNPHHLLHRFSSFQMAATTADFQAFVRQLDRNHPYERAEYLLLGLGGGPVPPNLPPGESPGEYAARLLGSSISGG